MNIYDENRAGKFFVDRVYFIEHADELMSFMSGILIVKAEMLFHRDGVEYVGYSDRFKPLGQGIEVLNYRLLVKHLGENKVEFDFFVG